MLYRHLGLDFIPKQIISQNFHSIYYILYYSTFHFRESKIGHNFCTYHVKERILKWLHVKFNVVTSCPNLISYHILRSIHFMEMCSVSYARGLGGISKSPWKELLFPYLQGSLLLSYGSTETYNSSLAETSLSRPNGLWTGCIGYFLHLCCW